MRNKCDTCINQDDMSKFASKLCWECTLGKDKYRNKYAIEIQRKAKRVIREFRNNPFAILGRVNV
jgi:hypothetical protein